MFGYVSTYRDRIATLKALRLNRIDLQDASKSGSLCESDKIWLFCYHKTLTSKWKKIFDEQDKLIRRRGNLLALLLNERYANKLIREIIHTEQSMRMAGIDFFPLGHVFRILSR